MKNLKRDFKKTIDHNRRSGVARKTMPFQDKLELILGDRPAAEPVVTFTSMEHEEEAEWAVAEIVDEEPDVDVTTDPDHHDHEDHADNSSLDTEADMDASTTSEEQETSMEAELPTPRTSGASAKKRPAAGGSSEASSSKTPRMSNRNAKTSRMRDTVSLVADAFKIQMDRSEHAYREEMRRQQQEQEKWEKQWREQAAEESKAFNDTMKSFLGVVTGMMNSHQQQGPSMQQGHGQNFGAGPFTASSWQHRDLPPFRHDAPEGNTSHRPHQQNRTTTCRPTHSGNHSRSTATASPPVTQANHAYAHHIQAPATAAPFPGRPISSRSATEPHTTSTTTMDQ